MEFRFVPSVARDLEHALQLFREELDLTSIQSFGVTKHAVGSPMFLSSIGTSRIEEVFAVHPLLDHNTGGVSGSKREP